LRGKFQNFRGFLNAKATEESQFDDARFSRVHFGQTVQGIIEGNQLGAALAVEVRDLIEVDGGGMVDALELASAFGRG